MYSPQVDEMPMPEIWYSPVFGMGFWINDIGLLMSVPAFCTAGDYDMENAIPVSDWENWDGMILLSRDLKQIRKSYL